MAFNGTGDTAIREEKVDKGKIVGFDPSALKDILDKYLRKMLPIEVEGDIEYFVNVADGAFYVTLINNDGVMKAPKTPVQFDSSSFGIHVKCMLKAGLSSLECCRVIAIS